MKETEWIVLKYDEKPNKMICQRCGAKALAPMPCRLLDAVAIFKTFKKQHRNCKNGQ